MNIAYFKSLFPSENNLWFDEEKQHKYSEDFKIERLKTNLKTEACISIILFFINTVLIFSDLYVLNTWRDAIFIIDILFIRCIMILFQIVCFYVIRKILDNGMTKRKFATFVHYVAISGNLLWSVVVVINEQYFHGQISPYIIALFCLVTIIYLSFIERIVFIGCSYALFLIGVFMIPISEKQLFGHLINSVVLIVLAYGVSCVVHKQYYYNYLKTKRIEEDSETILKLNSDLERTIRKRTKALMRKHKRLVEEIHKGHEASLEFLKAQNTSDVKRIELEKTIEQEKVRTMFFANMSHELRTPLNIIFSAQQMIESSLEGDIDNLQRNKLTKYSKMIKQNSYRLIRLIGNLIDITKIDSGHYKIRKSNVDIVKLIENIYTYFSEYISSKNIKVNFSTELSSKVIACDPDQVERILLNLLSNAIKFIPTEGVISISVYEKNNMVVFSVKDNGIGISDEQHESIFERFVQVDKSISRNHEGSGIGLSIVKNFVNMHGGKVYVESKLGEGSMFYVELPSDQLAYDEEESLDTVQLVESKVEKLNIEFSDIYFKQRSVG